MKATTLVSLLLTVLDRSVEAHYSFAKLKVNDGAVSEEWQYIRQLASSQIRSPFYYGDIRDTNIRCNTLEKTSWANTSTATVQAGDTLRFGIGYVPGYDYAYHPGPAQGYLSKATNNDLSTYKGDGDWFKIGEYGVLNRTFWVLQLENVYWLNFTIPKTTPPGKYLMRVEQMFILHPGFNKTQIYHSCAHVDISGPGGGTPGPTIKLPEGYDPKSPTIAAPGEVAFNCPENVKNFLLFKNPGPAVWKG